LLTSIVFAIETTGQSNALLPLLAACLASYFISYFLLENTIMTEKIARRGVQTPQTYEPDILEQLTVEGVMSEEGFVLSANSTIAEVRDWLQTNKKAQRNYYVVVTADGTFKGIISSSNLFSMHHNTDQSIGSLIKRKTFTVTQNERLKTAVEMMAKENTDVLPVTAQDSNKIIGLLSYKDVLQAYKYRLEEREERSTHISLKRRGLRILLHGKRQLTSLRSREEE
jgi:chloride channel protein, CIC family